MFTRDATKKWYVYSSLYTLLEVVVQLMLPHWCKNLPNVYLVYFHILLSVHIPAMDGYIVEVTRCKISHRSQQIYSMSVQCGSGIT